MIPDNQTNLLYLADCLQIKYPAFFSNFDTVLKRNQVNFKFLPGTKDIWAVDFMPIQIAADKFVQFDYNPDYLQFKKYQQTFSNVDAICAKAGIKPLKSNIKLDGGNVIRTENKVIMCDKVFRENPTIPEKELISQLRNLFEIDNLVFIPTQPGDFTGHADGLVRFLDDKTVLINDLSKEKPAFALTFRLALHNAGLETIEIPYNPHTNTKNDDAKGIYMNYLQMEDLLILPVFNMKEDEQVLIQFQQLFPKHKIDTVLSNDIAAEGGILNCITWNIKTTQL